MHKTDNPEPSFHYIATREEGRAIINQHQKFWVSDCGCREGAEEDCKRSRIDVCLFFDDAEMQGTGSGWKEVDREFVVGILKEAKEKHLVTRPFRYEKDRTRDQGICFCCDDRCYYFKGEEGGCDPGKYIEKTDMDVCTHCGECVSVCYFKARSMVEGKLVVNRKVCYGCGLCLDVCLEDCIQMVERN